MVYEWVACGSKLGYFGSKFWFWIGHGHFDIIKRDFYGSISSLVCVRNGLGCLWVWFGHFLFNFGSKFWFWIGHGHFDIIKWDFYGSIMGFYVIYKWTGILVGQNWDISVLNFGHGFLVGSTWLQKWPILRKKLFRVIISFDIKLNHKIGSKC